MDVKCRTEGCQHSCYHPLEMAGQQGHHSPSRISHLLGITEILRIHSSYLHRSLDKRYETSNYSQDYAEMRNLAIEVERKKAEALQMNSARKHSF